MAIRNVRLLATSMRTRNYCESDVLLSVMDMWSQVVYIRPGMWYGLSALDNGRFALHIVRGSKPGAIKKEKK